jgi:hypothetical protein
MVGTDFGASGDTAGDTLATAMTFKFVMHGLVPGIHGFG